jgi:hypothetical protein
MPTDAAKALRARNAAERFRPIPDLERLIGVDENANTREAQALRSSKDLRMTLAYYTADRDNAIAHGTFTPNKDSA